jgi:23S rRNA (cytidine1920-2'-O)/16S rRNA (cytidine1409-2'-O)-methyltransferase
MAEKKKAKLLLVDRLVQEGISATREEASKLVLAGLVRVNDQVIDKVGALVASDAVIRCGARKEFVSRAAQKLEAAFEHFPISVQGTVCADVGACTGGFTEILLQRGAAKVYAIDVGYGDLDWKIRNDARVVVMERTNARYVDTLGEAVSLVTIDVSFISLSKILPSVVRWLSPGGDIVALIKPQFEAHRDEIGPGGIVTDSAVHERVIERVMALLPDMGLSKQGLEPSPILGMEGNKEFLLWARLD